MTGASSSVGFQALDASQNANWRIAFFDADGIPLNMLSFEVIDFGAISYKEIFQNVKTILATPLYSAALERTLGLDDTIVDRPIGDAAQATVAILTAIMTWEPRCQVMNIDFDYTDALNGHLGVQIQLNINNVIYGTSTPYAFNNIFQTPTFVQSNLPPLVPLPGPAGPAGVAGPQGTRGSLWFTGTSAPPVGPLSPMKVPTTGPPGPQGAPGQRGFVWLQGTGDPVTPQANDMYLNTSNGDVWQFDGTTGTWRRTATNER